MGGGRIKYSAWSEESGSLQPNQVAPVHRPDEPSRLSRQVRGHREGRVRTVNGGDMLSLWIKKKEETIKSEVL